MKKMQCRILKIIAVYLLLTGIAAAPSYSQVATHRLQTADSLFNAKQLTQSLDHYKTILDRGEYTSAMLLKMAFVEKGRNRVGEALYYLNHYYLATGDEAALNKMQSLSKKHQLAGYAIDETGQVMITYQKNHDRISMGLGAVILLLVSVATFMSRRNQKPAAVLVMALLFAGVFAVHLSYRDDSTRIIVTGENNYLMAGPSGAAPVVAVIGGGHRFEIESRQDVWIKVRWKGKTAFIREQRVLPVQL